MALNNEMTWAAFDARLAGTPFKMERRSGAWVFVHKATGEVLPAVYRVKFYKRHKREVKFWKKGTILALERAERNTNGGLEWTMRQFIEKMEEVTMHAKADIEAAFSATLKNIGLEAVKRNPVKLLGFEPEEQEGNP